MRFPLTSHWDFVSPYALGLRRDEVGKFSRHVARGDAISTGELNHLDRYRLNEVNHGGLGGVVCSLQLGYIDNVPTHTRSSDKATASEIIQLPSEDICTFGLLSSPMLTGSIRAVIGTVHIGSHDLAVVTNFSVEEGPLRPRDTSVSNENVEATIELVNDLVHYFLDLLLVCYINLICPA